MIQIKAVDVLAAYVDQKLCAIAIERKISDSPWLVDNVPADVFHDLSGCIVRHAGRETLKG